MLYTRGDVKKKERETLHAITTRSLKEEEAGDTSCYTPEQK
jgi:hypothetical protein